MNGTARKTKGKGQQPGTVARLPLAQQQTLCCCQSINKQIDRLHIRRERRVMADDTLSPVGFERPICKATLPSEMRFAMACFAGQHDVHQPQVVRHLLSAGLESVGWGEERIIAEYAAYRVKCLRDGIIDEYGRE
jgi:hypothetical protein